MTHASAHAANTMHGFIQMHLAGTPAPGDAILAATAVTARARALPGVVSATAVDDTVVVYVEFAAPPAPWDPPTGTHDPVNDTTPAHARVLALRQNIARSVMKPAGTPFFDFGLSHNWCCYGDQ